MNCLVIVAAQINRESEKCQRPSKCHLKESGKIEEDADVIILLHRPEGQDDKKIEILECYVDKNRNGRIGKYNCHYHKYCGYIEEVANDTNTVV
jgi:replicative DNA helicase